MSTHRECKFNDAAGLNRLDDDEMKALYDIQKLLAISKNAQFSAYSRFFDAYGKKNFEQIVRRDDPSLRLFGQTTFVRGIWQSS